MTNDDRCRFTLRTPRELFVHIEKDAEKFGISLNALILQILWDWVKRQET